MEFIKNCNNFETFFEDGQVIEEYEWKLKKCCTGSYPDYDGCNTLFLINKDDIIISENVNVLGEKEYFYTMKCPICNKETSIFASFIPNSIKNELLRKKKKVLVENQ